MPIPRLFDHCLVRPECLASSREDLRVIGSFNPGAVRNGQETIILVRVAERPKNDRPGLVPLPRWNPEGEIVVDWIAEEEIERIDARLVRLKSNGAIRLTFTSHLRVLRSKDGRCLDNFEGLFFCPQSPYEEYGVEDPRITPIGDDFYITYVAVSRHGAATALASTKDFKTFKRHGIIFYPENKDVVLFPEKINGAYVAIHRPNPSTRFSPPEMWMALSYDLQYWGEQQFFLGGDTAWGSDRIGGGTPPIRTPEGWLLLYHGCSRRDEEEEVGTYTAGALLLDPDNPIKILRHSPEPILVPETEFETKGFVPNVVFPTGIVETEKSYLIYYGASDTFSGVVGLDKGEVLKSLLH